VGDITALNIGDTVRLIWQSDGRPMVAAGAAIEDDSELPVSSNTYYEFKEQTTAPDTPASGYGKLYEMSNNFLYFRSDTGIPVPAMIGRVAYDNFLGWYRSGVTTTSPETPLNVLKFRDAYADYIGTSLHLPHGWAGKTLTVTLFWAPSTTNTGTVIWKVDIYRIQGGANYPTSTASTSSFSESAPGTTKRVVKSATTVSLSSFVEGDLLYINLTRDGVNDGYNSDISLAGLSLSIVG